MVLDAPIVWNLAVGLKISKVQNSERLRVFDRIMAASITVHALAAVHSLGESLLNLGIGIYKKSPQLDDFASKIDELHYKEPEWIELLTNGVGSESSIHKVLRASLGVLGKEEKRLEKRRNSTALLCWAGHKPVEFSPHLTECVQRVITEFDTLLIDRSRSLDLWDVNTTPRLRPDERYVKQEEILEEVRDAIEDPDGPRIVVVHGGPGLGKSSLVRHLANEYQRKSEPLDLDLSLTSGAKFRNSEAFEGFPDGVVYLDAGVGADTLAKHMKLLQATGGSIAVLDHGRNGMNFPKGLEIRRRLQTWLREKNLLVIVDDVVEVEFLERLVVAGAPGVKYLVTSELKKEFWDRMTDVDVIELKNMEPRDARQLLANHIGMPWGQIPPRMEEIADDIIQKLDSNPLLLTDIAMTISRQRREDVEEWRAAKENLLDLIFKENVVTFGLQSNYPKCAPCTMTMALNSLPDEPKTLLLLVAACRGPTVPEVVLKMLFKKHVGRLLRFYEWKKLLEERDLVRIQDKNSTNTSWSVHTMRKKFTLEKRRSELVWIMECMFRESDQLDGILYTEEERLLASVCALYGDDKVSEIGFQKLKVRFDIGEVRRIAMEPIMWLLDVEPQVDWKRRAYRLARQAFLRFVSQGHLDDESITGLLAIPLAAAAACTTIEAIANISSERLLKPRGSGILDGLLTLLTTEAIPSDQKAAASALGALAVRNYDIILAHPLILERLVDLLDKSFNPVVQASALVALGNLAQSSESITLIGGYPGMLEGLVELLDTFVSKEAAYTMARMTCIQSSFHADIATYSLAVDRLVQLSRDRDVSGETKAYAVRALANLAWTNEATLDLADCPGNLKAMVELLDDDLNPEVQEQAARVLAGLAALSYENKVRIGAIPESIPNLIRLISIDENHHVQEAVAVALEYLALAQENRRIILLLPETLETFQKMLTEDVMMTKNLQTSVVGLVATLLEVNEDVVAFSGAVDVLVGLLACRDSTADLQQHAARALANLAAQGEAQKLSIAATPGAIENLQALLAKQVSEEVQHQALKALANLAVAPRNRVILSSSPGLVDRLLDFLGMEVLPSLQLHAARAFTFLDPDQSKGTTLHAIQACYGRGEALMEMEMYEEAMADLNKVGELKPLDTFFMRRRSFAKAMLKDYQGALLDADKAVELQPLIAILWQERGILKQLTGDLEGALNDLERALELTSDDYETIKHRGYVKFLLNDEKGAREDAEKALQIMSSRDAVRNMKRMPSHIDAGRDRERFLGRHAISYLGYDLR
ncbi:hypothetical protein MPTK1_5g10840 [Marchantia polymorpha subsp. ruderalis]|uniref:Protein unc-45 homolog B n=2 Tax=Marchantia polymorpha TaxID=3197 RepID=A0A176W1K8_MARPO|nr:hypothetical protein AXG93_1480s1100 [Marchantia polymorpha subsp. ruderalis]PTQ32920.1 hypothetical protein MARPO_0093s0005 [Marchantia polymorpha]BBN11314.1 hypothetical protein Mp_5g10840 [Marchantia polymorpha subsp. ruderalis]|eukprot:PTQ32920.1 hypothetical protein MARPO_0093s0005 [Marchantia polymorpha]